MAAEKDRARGRPGAAAQPVAIFGAVFAAAAIFYSFHLGRDPLGASEAYSAYAAARPSVGAIVHIPIADDPGKQLLYYIVLHYWTMIFGAREAGLRAMSVVFGLGTIAMIFALGRDLFDDADGRRRGRDVGVQSDRYGVFVPGADVHDADRFRTGASCMRCAALARSSSVGWTLACAVSGAAVIYTHLGGAAILAAEVAILIRDFMRGRRSIAPWLALAGAALLFAPYLPIASAQSRVLIAGHWLDWIGPAYHYSSRDEADRGDRRYRNHVMDGLRPRARSR